MAASHVAAFWAVAMLLIIVPGADWAFVLSSSLDGRTAVLAVGGLVLGYAVLAMAVAAGVGALVARSAAILAGLTIAGGLYLIWHGARTLARPAAPGAAAEEADTTARATGSTRQATGRTRQATGTTQPATGRTRQATGTTQPATGRTRQATGTTQPATGRTRQATGTTQPATGRTGRVTVARGAGVSALNPKGLLLFLALLPQFTSPHWGWPLPVQLGFLGLVFMLSVAAFYLCLGSFARRSLNSRPAAARAVSRLSGAAMIVIGALLLIERLVA
jgi:threonine/homoserine/homoserine lactone efflux protein